MADYRSATLMEYLDALAARASVPGGGSAAALDAAMGVALISMVINFTIGKPRYARYEKELKKALEKSEKLREEFLQLVDLDAAAYKSRSLRDALDVPFMVCRLCLEGAKLLPGLVKNSNPNLISDVAVAAAFLESAFSAAYFNVRINLKSLNDKKLDSRINKELLSKEKILRRIRYQTEEKVGKIIRG
ncbi:MAG: cyclodeaminase/cyclohydrolase family protein [Candidatus Omnitrophota bacterium]